MAPRRSPQEYQASAQEAFACPSPDERLQLGQYLQQRTRQQGIDVPVLNGDRFDDRLQGPAYLARTVGRLDQ